MAIDFLQNLNVKGSIALNNNQINDFVVDHSNTSDATNVTGKLIYDSGTLKYYDGSSWQSLGTSSGTMSSWVLSDDDGDDVTISDGKYVKIFGVSGSGVTTNLTDTDSGSSSDEFDLEIGLSNVPNSALANSTISGVALGGNLSNLTVDDTTIELNSGTTYNGSAARTISAKTAAIANGGAALATADQIHTFVTTQTDSMAADTSGNAATATLATTVTVTEDSSSNTNFHVVFHDGSNGLKDESAAGGFYYNPSTETLSVKNISVSGTQTTNNVEVINTSSGVVFEGSTDDGNETTLDVIDPTADRAINLPNASGTVALFAAASTSTITSTPAELNVLDGYNGSVTELNYLKALYDTGVTSTEYDYLDGVTSNIQTQLNGKQATITGAATTIDDTDLTASRALVSNGSGKVAVSAVTSTEVGYLDGVTSAIQTQLDAKKAAADHVTKKLSGDGSNTTYTITHGFNTPIVSCTVLDYGNDSSGATYDQVMVEIKRNSDNAVDVIFATAPTTSEDYLVLISKFPAIS
tara:strand:- start:143 stop:1717 length:1575 start_codon:yes stop_codon:yes gene_type:complete